MKIIHENKKPFLQFRTSILIRHLNDNNFEPADFSALLIRFPLKILRNFPFLRTSFFLVGYYAASSGNYIQTFWDKLSVPTSRFKNPKKESRDQPNNQPTNHPNNHPTNQPNNQPNNHPNHQPIIQPINQRAN